MSNIEVIKQSANSAKIEIELSIKQLTENCSKEDWAIGYTLSMLEEAMKQINIVINHAQKEEG